MAWLGQTTSVEGRDMATDAEIRKFVQHHHGFIPKWGGSLMSRRFTGRPPAPLLNRSPPRVLQQHRAEEVSGGSPGLATEEEVAMKPVTLVGIALIILGVLALAYQGITYTTREKVIDLGPLKASVDKEKRIPLPPIVGVVALAGGVVLVIVGARKS
jgi:hypothetical protein